MSFLGYPRADGTAGARNYVLVLPGGLVSTKICEFVNGTRTIITPDVGSGRTKRDRETIARMLVGLGRNPNIAGVIMHDINPGGGYPELGTETIASQIAETGKPVEIISSRQYPDAMDVIGQGVRVARQMVRDASHIRRESFGDGHLSVGVKCGHSDSTSGIAGNPTVGYLFDHIVGEGGTAFFGETTEIIGAEHILAKRGINEKVGRDIIDAARETEERAKSFGEDIRTINPVPSNIAGGISTLEEKSLGAIAKGGTAPIQGVLRYAEAPPGKGLYFVDNWMTQMSIFPGYAAAGATVTLFQLGGGGFRADTLLMPMLGVVSPLLWATANKKSWSSAGESVDFYSGTVIEGEETLEEAGERLCELVRQVASGSMTKTETINYQAPSQAYLLDAPF
jgi:altronate dehydratase large subunit